MSTLVRTRIAPSPTGDWHLGTTRTAIFCWLFARRHKGKFYLRIEDTDQARLVPGAVERLQHVLTWLTMDPDPLPDGRPYMVQSENLERYRSIAEQLVEAGHAYYCFATTEELDAMRAEQQAASEPPHYDNRWGYRDLSSEQASKRVQAGDAYVIRQKMPQAGEITLQDEALGTVTFEARLLDDTVLLKSDGYPTYHLAHVVDDHDMNITHVFRGAEWLPSAPRHVVLHQALGWTVPTYVHVPVILGPDKGKLAKRHGAKPVYEYAQDGYLPEALLNFLALLGWSTGSEEELFTPEELIAHFSIERIQPSPAKFDAERLDWFNATHIRRLSGESLRDRLLDYWREHDPVWVERYEHNPLMFDAIVTSLHERLITLKEFAELAYFYYEDPTEYSVDLLVPKQQTKQDTLRALEFAVAALRQTTAWSHDALESLLRSLAQDHGLKPGHLLWPIRAALTGVKASPGAFEVLSVLGKETSLQRLEKAIRHLSS